MYIRSLYVGKLLVAEHAPGAGPRAVRTRPTPWALLDRDGIKSFRRWLGRVPGPKPRLPSATVRRRLMNLITLRPFEPDDVEPITEHLAMSFISGISASRTRLERT